MFKKIALGLLLLTFFSCENEEPEPTLSIAGVWDITIFQKLSIEGAEVLEDLTLQDVGQLSLHEGGTGTAAFKTIEPLGFTTSLLKWSLQDDVIELEFSSSGLRTFELNLTEDQNHLALTEMLTAEETDLRPDQFQMITIQLIRRA